MTKIGVAKFKGHEEIVDNFTTFADLAEFGYRHDEWFDYMKMEVTLDKETASLAEWYARAEAKDLVDPDGAPAEEMFYMIELVEG